ncbi:MAG: phosphoribosylaminoimidazole-succinocarboxamide synthase [Rhodothermales bacterium]|jgi:phosphoribosylaminoimidazole-succinocarboxamide synthase
MDESLIRDQLAHSLPETHFEDLGTRYRGKVRDTYASGDRLVLVTTDRISAFDHVLRQTIPFKGQVLNRLAAFCFAGTQDVVPNHIVSVPDPNVTLAHRCESIPIEFVVRGYLAGHAWRTYRSGLRQLCGVVLPAGLRQNSRLPSPILTPATKADEGHDEDISRGDILVRGLLDESTLSLLEGYALSLFRRGTEMAAKQGLILVDTKYEFGKRQDGTYVVIDEIHTPDSSRYFYADTYDELLSADKPQRQLSKEFVREWLMSEGFQGLEGQDLPDMPDAFRTEVAARYVELYERITGEDFQPDTSRDPVGRIRKSLASL